MSKKILIVRPDGIGDFVIFSAVLEQYAKLYAGYHIDLLCHPKVKELAVTVPFVRDIFYIDVLRMNHKKYFPYLAYLWAILNCKGYEKIIYPVYSRIKEAESFLRRISAKEKIVFDGNNSNDPDKQRLQRNKYFTRIVVGTTAALSEIKRNAEFVKALGATIDMETLQPKIWFLEQDDFAAQKILNNHHLSLGQYICIFPGAGNKIRHWESSSWIKLFHQLGEHYPDFKVVLVGFGDDLVPIQAILQGLSPGRSDQIVNLYNKMNLRELAKILQHAKLCIGMETGTTHIAAAVGVANICIMGGGHFRRFYPYGDLSRYRIVYSQMDCFDCNWQCIYDETKCIRNIKVENVWHEVEALLGGQKVGR